MISCSRCGRPAPVDEDELTGDGGGDPSLLPVLVPPEEWQPDPDDEDRIICGGCVTPAERRGLERQLREVGRILQRVVHDEDDDDGEIYVA